MRLNPALPRTLLCLALLASSVALAEEPEAQPLEEPPPSGQTFPREQEQESASVALLVGRPLLQLPAGLMAGAIFSAVSLVPIYLSSYVGCFYFDDPRDNSDTDNCAAAITLVGVSLVGVLGIGSGVSLVGNLMEGRGYLPGVLGGALVGMGGGMGIAAALSSPRIRDSESLRPMIIGGALGSTLGATVAYVISDALAPEPSSTEAQAVASPSLLPVLGPTRSGGFVAGIAGRF